MSRFSPFLVLAVMAGIALLGPVPAIARRTGRPRYIVALVGAALVAAAWQSLAAVGFGASGAQRFLFGVRLTGVAARVYPAVDAALCAVGAWGLWRQRRWARHGAMAYLGLRVVSFLFWGLDGTGVRDALELVLWQLLVLPFLVFSLMYLSRDGARFR